MYASNQTANSTGVASLVNLLGLSAALGFRTCPVAPSVFAAEYMLPPSLAEVLKSPALRHAAANSNTAPRADCKTFLARTSSSADLSEYALR